MGWPQWGGSGERWWNKEEFGCHDGLAVSCEAREVQDDPGPRFGGWGRGIL